MKKGSNEYEFANGFIEDIDNGNTYKVHKIEILTHFNKSKPQIFTMSKFYKDHTDEQETEINNGLLKIYNSKNEFLINCIDDDTGETQSFKCSFDEAPNKNNGIIYGSIIEKL